MESFIKTFSQTGIKDAPVVGGKNASLGEMFNQLSPKGIRIPDGFATTAFAYWTFLDFNNLWEPLQKLMQQLDRKNFSNLHQTGSIARTIILSSEIPDIIAKDITAAYNMLCGNEAKPVAVRSSATAEDMPEASFAGQHESFLNVKGSNPVLDAVLRCFASLYTDRAIKYREDNGFEHSKVALSAGIQLMVRSDIASSGISFTIDPDTGFKDVVHISGIWGLGENIVQGAVEPDEYYVFKPALLKDKQAIIQKKTGTKSKTMCYKPGTGETQNIPTPPDKRTQMVLTDGEVIQLAKWSLDIEQHYNCPMDIEWAKDGLNGQLYIVQARPETVYSQKNRLNSSQYTLLKKGDILVRGQAIGTKVVTGIARILQSPADAWQIKAGEIVVTDTTSPDWDPILKKVAAIITNTGGRTSHAAIVAREQGVAAIVGTGNATEKIKNGIVITVSCCEGGTGYVYNGILPYREEKINYDNIIMPQETDAMLIMSDPDQAFKLSFYPNNGVGLLRMEFIITSFIGIHPMALVKYEELQDAEVKKQIELQTQGYGDKRNYFIDRLSQGIATIAAAFYPKDVVVRMSDFKTNEYAALTGGKQFEPAEDNPMLGFRGASRYYHPLYREGFGMECAAIKVVRDQMGLTNVKVMIPFCRTVDEGKKVLSVMEENGLKRGENGLEVYVMVEIPSNVIEGEKFAHIFDGFSIGSNDLTQLTLGIDRDSALVAPLFNEQDPAVLEMISTILTKAKKAGKHIGFCGQAPSDIPEMAIFLVRHGINSISFNPDAILKGIENINKAEKEMLLHALAGIVF